MLYSDRMVWTMNVDQSSTGTDGALQVPVRADVWSKGPKVTCTVGRKLSSALNGRLFR